MFSKTLPALLIGCAAASASVAETQIDMDDFFVNCISDVNSEGVTLVRSGGSDKGYIMTTDVQGEADIYPGLDSMTFLLMQETGVITFVVDYHSMEYDMMVKGAGQQFDRGTCSAS